MPESDSDAGANIDAALTEVDPSRRAFIRRMVVGAAVAPVVTSFSMAALSSQPAYAQVAPNTSGSNQQ